MAAKSLAPSLTRLEQTIFLIRGEKVLLDSDLAELYGVTTGQLNRAVRRNMDRFPGDFMFQLTRKEAESSRCQNGILKRGQNIKYLPYAFTEQGVAMLSSVLASPRAVKVNIAIMRVFIRLRETLSLHKELARRLSELERKVDGQDENIQKLFDTIHHLLEPALNAPRKEMAFISRKKKLPIIPMASRPRGKGWAERARRRSLPECGRRYILGVSIRSPTVTWMSSSARPNFSIA